MPKVAIVGAGSIVFTRNLCSDILLTPSLQGCTISLMDIDAVRLQQSYELVRSVIERRGLSAQVMASLDRRESVKDADYVIATFQQGGLDAYKIDIDIPQLYGVEQCVGDTIGPGGVFRALRTIPALLELCRDLDDVAPEALLLNYVNPMAANCWAIAAGSGRPHVGLCHSVQGTSEMLARWIDVPYSEVVFRCAGINHQAWFLEFKRLKEDLYPLIWEAIARDEIYAQEPVRIELMKYLGYFVTESSGHASEYVPYFRKTAQMVNEDLVPRFADEGNAWFDYGRTGGNLRCRIHEAEQAPLEYRKMIAGEIPLPTERTHEYGSFILESIETNQPCRIAGNMPNRGLIDNLPTDCCVEVPCLVDGDGIQPTKVGPIPAHLAAINRTNINVQELIVEAALNADIDAVHHAVMLDPLTAAVCTLPQIHSMVDEMLQAEAPWLPQMKSR